MSRDEGRERIMSRDEGRERVVRGRMMSRGCERVEDIEQ